MNKNNKLELLDTELLSIEEFKIIHHWLKVFKLEVGWHYILDLTWQLKEIRKLNLPKKATIIDAGAGHGLMQFILASLGYDIISIDFNQRRVSKLYSKLFTIQNDNNHDFDNEYVKHLSEIGSLNIKTNFINKLIKSVSFRYIVEIIKSRFTYYGKIKFETADFSHLNTIQNNSIDAIVSTSAIEHNNDFEKIKLSLAEFYRVLKKDATMFITSSATNKSTWWHKPSKGYCFSEVDLKDIFNMPDCKSNYTEFDHIFSNIKSSNFLKKKLPSYYYNNPNCGMPMGIWDPKYIPVGIVKYKY